MKTCPFCNRRFSLRHGNQVYCSPQCKNFQKAASQKKLYGLLKEFRKGFLNNFRLFEQLLPPSGKRTIDLSQLIIKGFKPDCYYKSMIDNNGQTWYQVENYYYSVSTKGHETFINLLNTK